MKSWSKPFYLILNWCPGALGLLLRKRFFPRLFDSCGKNVLFGRFIHIQNPKQIVIGDHVVISDRVILDAGCMNALNQHHLIIIMDHVFIGIETTIKAVSAPITIRPGANLSSYCHLLAHIPIDIGSDTLLAAYCRIGCESPVIPEIIKPLPQEGIKVANGCWLGVRVRIEDSVTVGEGTIVGAHAAVAHDLPEYTIAIGNPAKSIKYR